MGHLADDYRHVCKECGYTTICDSAGGCINLLCGECEGAVPSYCMSPQQRQEFVAATMDELLQKLNRPT